MTRIKRFRKIRFGFLLSSDLRVFIPEKYMSNIETLIQKLSNSWRSNYQFNNDTANSQRISTGEVSNEQAKINFHQL